MTKRLEFSAATKRKAYELRGGKCPGLVELKMPCGNDLSLGVEFDHILRCEIYPDNSLENCRPLCKEKCHKLKTRLDAAAAAKGRRIRKETKKSRRTKAKIPSRGFPSKEERERAKQWREKL